MRKDTRVREAVSAGDTWLSLQQSAQQGLPAKGTVDEAGQEVRQSEGRGGGTPGRPGGWKEEVKGHRKPRGHSTNPETGRVLSDQSSGALTKSSCRMDKECTGPVWLRGGQLGGMLSLKINIWSLCPVPGTQL